jgi:hypothetical protein
VAAVAFAQTGLSACCQMVKELGRYPAA